MFVAFGEGNRMTGPIRKHRVAIGLNRTELAALLDASVPLVGVLERGEGLPQSAHLKTLAGIFGISEDRLLEECLSFRGDIRETALRKAKKRPKPKNTHKSKARPKPKPKPKPKSTAAWGLQWG